MDVFTNPVLDSDIYGRVGFDTSGGNLENTYRTLFNEQNSLNQLQMIREDTAYQRMVKDMQNAGLSPWTGISSGGSSSSALTPPHKSALDGLISMLNLQNDVVSHMNDDSIKGYRAGLDTAFGWMKMLF